MNSVQYYTRQGRKIQGPFDIDRLRRLASLGRFSRGHQVSMDRVSWFPASELVEIFGEMQAVAVADVEQEPGFDGDTVFQEVAGPRKKRLLLWIGIPVTVVVLAAGGVGVWWFVAGNNSGGSANRGQEIVGIDDDQELNQAIGFLVSGKRYVTKEGKILEFPLGNGSCFMISPSGYALTNKHVVDSTLQLQRAKNKLKSERDAQGLEDIEPILVAFFGGKSYPVEVVFVSDSYDMAVVKVRRQSSPYFRLSEATIDRRSKVWAFGFPGAAIDKSAILEKVKKAIRAEGDSRMKRQFSRQDFKYTSTGGGVSRVVEQGNDGEVIQHDAPINAGNSGGPLVSSDGVVFGINTRVATKAQGIFFSLTLKQLRAEIDEHVPDAVWK